MSAWWTLEPADVWFFRDAKPFTAGESHRAESRFPPPPATLLGALRTGLIAREGVAFHDFAAGLNQETWQGLLDIVGGPSQPGALAVQGPFPRRIGPNGDQILLPWPQDLLGKNRLAPLAEALSNLLVNDPPLRLTWTAGAIEDNSEVPSDSWAELRDLLAYLAGGSALAGAATDADLFSKESHTGLALGPSRSAVPGMLYIAEMIRMTQGDGSHCGLAFRLPPNVRDIELPSGPLALGGKSRSAELAPLPEDTARAIEKDIAEHGAAVAEKILSTRRFRVYAATPALFQAGWHPDCLKQGRDRLEGTFAPGIPVELVSAVVGKPIPVGGWDLARKRAKPLYRAVPAGSVYHFRIPEGHPLDEATALGLVARFNFADGFRAGCTSVLPDAVTAGFGVTLIGTWEPKGLS